MFCVAILLLDGVDLVLLGSVCFVSGVGCLLT